jgi:hypothetical protein
VEFDPVLQVGVTLPEALKPPNIVGVVFQQNRERSWNRHSFAVE